MTKTRRTKPEPAAKQRMVALPADLFQGVLDYLTARPYAEVAALVAGIAGSAAAVDIDPPAPAAPTPPAA